MYDLKPLTCANCGAPLGRHETSCPYCDTQYAAQDVKPMPIMAAAIPRTERICASVAVDGEYASSNLNMADVLAQKRVLKGLAQELLKYATITVTDDPCSFRKIINATVEVVKPKGV